MVIPEEEELLVRRLDWAVDLNDDDDVPADPVVEFGWLVEHEAAPKAGLVEPDEALDAVHAEPEKLHNAELG